MAEDITETEIIAFLKAVESGQVVLTPLDDPQAVYAGNVRYAASNGWSITVFNDCNEWDYIDYLGTADGRECDYDEIYHRLPEVKRYEPSPKISWNCYGLPGAMSFRCVQCGQSLTKSERKPPFRCPDCRSLREEREKDQK